MLIVRDRGVFEKGTDNGIGSVDPAAEFDHSVNHLIGAFTDAHDLSVRQGDHGIGCLFNMFDQIRVQDE